VLCKDLIDVALEAASAPAAASLQSQWGQNKMRDAACRQAQHGARVEGGSSMCHGVMQHDTKPSLLPSGLLASRMLRSFWMHTDILWLVLSAVQLAGTASKVTITPHYKPQHATTKVQLSRLTP
jgi:hypothetical protein